MATTTQTAAPLRTKSPLALWHLLSFDAPTIAALWTWFVGLAFRIHIPVESSVSIAIAVWILYVIDRLLDSRHLLSDPTYTQIRELEARHFFHFQHRREFVFGVGAAAIVLATLLPALLQATFHLYLSAGALLILWFLLVHSTRMRLPKEFVVGAYFALAIFTPTLVRDPAHSIAVLISGGLFAAVCSLNCLFINAWERTDWSSSRKLTAGTILVIAFSTASTLTPRTGAPAVGVACASAAVLLLILDRLRTCLSRIHLRAAADLALLTPLLVAPFLR